MMKNAIPLLASLWLSAAQAQTPVSPTPNSWGLGTPMPTARDAPFTAVIGPKVYVIGGATSGTSILNVNEVYDTTTNTWTTAAPLPTPRVGGATAVVNNILYAIGGGITGGGNTVNIVEAYDSTTNTWATKSPLPLNIDSMTAVVENGIIYVVGGFNNGSRLNILLAYDPTADTWSTLAPLHVAKSNSAAALLGSVIVSAGGISADNTNATADNEGYNAASNSWTTLAPVPSVRVGTCFGAVGGVLYLAGGDAGNNGTASGTMYAYNAVTNSWTSNLPTMPNAVIGAASASVGGLLYCFGGSNSNELGGKIYSYVQIYQPTLTQSQMNQTITFASPGGQALGTGPLQLSASASSGLGVTLTSNSPAVCTVSGTSVALVAVGTCSITASQPGNAIYAAAAPVTQTFNIVSANPPPALQLITVAPCRVMDTRNPNGSLGGPFIAGGMSRTIPVPSSACGIPADASAYSLNFTVVPRTGVLAYLSVWSAGQPQPLVSTLNSLDGSTIANAAIVPAGDAGAIEAFVTNDTDLIVDINGYFVPPASDSLQFYPLPPCRVLDTRNADGVFGGPSIAGGTSRSFPIPSSSCGAPDNAAAYAFNVTVVPQGALAYLTAWPTGQAQPVVSTLNSFDGTILANAAIVPAGTGGAASFYASDGTNLVVDINGYFATPGTGGLNFYTAIPCRLVDTRGPNGSFGGPTFSPGTTRAFPLSEGACGLPGFPGAQAYSLNITAVPQGALGYLSTWPNGGTQPVVSTLNALKGQIVANAAIVPAGGTGSIDVYVTNTTDVVIDTNGYFGQ
jgi:N-acetylneuraminic acid mutarotase